MAVVYIITNTEGSDEFAIQPGTLNGPDGDQQNTDLRLPGNGLAIWGEAYNENIYRLTENFAVFEKSPGVPEDEGDLGSGNGINVPLEGQLWWNKTQQRIFVFDDTSWGNLNVASSGTTAEVPASCSAEGILFFDTDKEQLLVCDGTGFVSVAERYILAAGGSPLNGFDMGGQRIINLGDPIDPQDAVTKNYAENTFLALDANNDPMTENLDMGGNELENLPTPVPFTGGDEAASRDYVDNAIATLSLAAEIGDVRMTVDQTILPGWLECNGETIGNGASGADQVVANALLFDIVKLGFGNTGAESFAGNDTVDLPDFRGRAPISRGQGSGLTNRVFGTEAGAETHQLTIPEMPSHTHTFDQATNLFNLDTHAHFRYVTLTSRPQAPTSPTGGDGFHNNMGPSLTVLFLIKT